MGRKYTKQQSKARRRGHRELVNFHMASTGRKLTGPLAGKKLAKIDYKKGNY